MRKITPVLFLLFNIVFVSGQSKYKNDFLFYWETVNRNFAYFDRQKTDWEKVKTIYQPQADTVTSDSGFVHLLERVNNELYNGHVFLNKNTNSSNRLIPSGSDIKVSYENDGFVITETREGFNADLCGLKPGMRIIKYNDISIENGIQKFLPKSVTSYDKEMYEYAGNMLLAGVHNEKRKITVSTDGHEKSFYPDSIPNKTEENFSGLLQSKKMTGNIGYIRINNSLGNSDLIIAFDTALDSLMDTDGLIIDLRETPGGGNTTVARAIMGRFIEKELPYQKHIYTGEERETGIRRSTLELVSPREKIYKKPLVVLVGNWTGSMGEGLAIGFDGLNRAKIAGTRMAGLLGEIYTFETPELKIPFSFPCVKLQHINGQPREDYKPAYLETDPGKVLESGINLIKSSKGH